MGISVRNGQSGYQHREFHNSRSDLESVTSRSSQHRPPNSNDTEPEHNALTGQGPKLSPDPRRIRGTRSAILRWGDVQQSAISSAAKAPPSESMHFNDPGTRLYDWLKEQSSYREFSDQKPQMKRQGFLKKLLHPSRRTALKIAWYGTDALVGASVLAIAIGAAISTGGAALPLSIGLMFGAGMYLCGSHLLRNQLLP